jgi:hypothetical protein
MIEDGNGAVRAAQSAEEAGMVGIDRKYRLQRPCYVPPDAGASRRPVVLHIF